MGFRGVASGTGRESLAVAVAVASAGSFKEVEDFVDLATRLAAGDSVLGNGGGGG